MEAVQLDTPQTLNLYSYCGNDPVNHIDPDGLFFGFLIGVFAAIFGAIGTAIAVVAKVIVQVVLTVVVSVINAIGTLLVNLFDKVPWLKSVLITSFTDDAGGVSWKRLIISSAIAGAGAVASQLQARKGKGKVRLSGTLLTAYNAARDRLLKLLRNPQSDCAKFLKSKGIDPNKVANVLQSQSAYDGLKSTIDAADAGINDLFSGRSVQSVFQDFGWRAARGKGSDVYYSQSGVRAPTILHETLHQQIGRISDPDLATKIGISSADYQKANDSGIIDDALAKAGCK
jgi:hypothetical protein